MKLLKNKSVKFQFRLVIVILLVCCLLAGGIVYYNIEKIFINNTVSQALSVSEKYANNIDFLTKR